ncbi:hypothetical protein GCM10022631_43620 [Deinococcus rubellus]|uniref:Uncharacterized protein n=1 Tax=Deinococcus rubellus TaxID=1889240 RepID=A0ABY5YM17_9DEIO|nr:hypothetical protein [Deinococcus rubellus]UWX65166.1 hypothetical protein N0D28_05780 [Deinococcus rubellus]
MSKNVSDLGYVSLWSAKVVTPTSATIARISPDALVTMSADVSSRMATDKAKHQSEMRPFEQPKETHQWMDRVKL